MYEDYRAGFSVPVILAGSVGRVGSGTGAGAVIGGAVGLAGGPAAEVTVPGGAAVGAAVGGIAANVSGVDVAAGQWAQQRTAELLGSCG